MYYYQTKVGVFQIVERSGKWQIIFEDENLGNYLTPHQAADDLAGGHTFSPGRNIDTSTLEISADISEWQKGRL